MLAYLLVAGGVAVLGATVVAARGTRPRPPEPVLDPTDPWSAYAPVDEPERRARLWPVVAALTGVVLIMGGVVAALTPAIPPVNEEHQSFSVELEPPGELEAVSSPEPTEGTVVAAVAKPRTPRPVTRTPRAPAVPAGGGTAVRPAPRPTPTPNKPGPAVGASTSCFGGTISVEYTATARGGTTLKTLRVNFNGRVVQQPSVAGRRQHTGSFSAQTTRSSNSLSITATQSDGGFASKSFPVKCT